MTYCKAEMKFIDVSALSDAQVATDDNQDIGNVALFQCETAQADYGTLELNQFLLDGSKSILQSTPTDIAFWSDAMSKDDCTFDENPTVTVTFTGQHSSSGLTLYFADDYPAELRISWYTVTGVELITQLFRPTSCIYVCKTQVENYGKVTIEITKTRLPKRYVKLQYILYGQYVVWDREQIKTAKVQEDIDVTSATLAINQADISIVDESNDFDIGNEDGAWKSVQKTQEVTLTEYKDGDMIQIGAFYIDDFSFSKNVAKFKLVDAIGLLDKYTFYSGQIYNNVKASVILRSIFQAAGFEKYSIDDDVGNILISGYLGIQTCRKALQHVCFACGAVADDSRSDTIHIYKPDRYVKATVGLDRKFNGGTTVALDKYISGVSIECQNYSLEDKTSQIYKNTLPVGESRITFSAPYLPSSVTASAGTIKEVKTNYIVVVMTSAGECKISGRKYASTAMSYQKNVVRMEAGETENIKKYSGCTLYNAELLPSLADKLLSYHALRKNVKMKYLVELEQVGNWVNIDTLHGDTATTLIEKQSIDLTGGYIATATCRGYSAVVTDYYYTGTELTANGEVII